MLRSAGADNGDHRHRALEVMEIGKQLSPAFTAAVQPDHTTFIQLRVAGAAAGSLECTPLRAG